MIEIKRMLFSPVGTIVFEDASGQWWQLESYNSEPGAANEWEACSASKIDNPLTKLT